MRLTKRSGVTTVLALVVVLGLGIAASAKAPTDNSGNPSILSAVNAVQSTLNTLASTVAGLVTTVNTINTAVAVGNTLFTPPVVAFPPDTLICTVTNVTDVSRTIKVELINGNTAAVLNQNSATGSVTVPGLSTEAIAGSGATGTRAFCKVTVTDGAKTDVRGVLALYAAATASDKVVIAAE